MVRSLFLMLLAGLAPAASAQEPGRPLRILLANDDGYAAPGLIALADSLAPGATVIVAAPAEQQSGTGHGITYRDPIMLREVPNARGLQWYAIGARPATVVRVALEALLDSLPDLVVSGINAGENIGLSAWLSGTVAAAREAAFSGIPALAVSLGGHEDDDYAWAAGYTRRLVERLRHDGLLRAGLLLNVNVPAGAARAVRGTKVTRESLRPSVERYERRVSPGGQVYFWSVYRPPSDDAPGTDLHEFLAGYVTITPLSIDQTAPGLLERLAGLAGGGR